MHSRLLIPSLVILYCCNALPADAKSPDFSRVPGTVIAHYPKSTGKYIGSPGIAIVSDGVYLAKYDEFGPSSTEHESAISQLYRSEDAGRTWTHVRSFNGLFWASIFTQNDHVYLLGTNKHHGKVVIFRSTDRGSSWTTPTNSENGVLREGENHTAPVPVITHNGRVWRAVEDASNGDVWGQRYSAMVMSAPIDSNLLKASNWTFSNALPRDASWLDRNFNGWLEGNAVVTPGQGIVNILRVDCLATGERAAIVRVSDDGTKATFDPTHDFIKFPGGSKKFTIRYDKQTSLYWTLANVVPEFESKLKPAATRNTLALASSPNLREWLIRSVVLYHPDASTHAFQYVDWLFERDDMIVVSRTAYDDGLGGAHLAHDANFLTFHRLKNFRKRTMGDSDPAYLKRANESK